MCKKISSWYKVNRLKINIDKTKVMLIGSKSQLKSLNVDDFILSYDDTPLELVENAIYHVYKLWYLMGFPRSAPLSKYVLPYIITKMNLLLQVYKSYIQPCLDYGITLYGCSTQKNIDLVQRVQNHAARLIMGNFDYINCRGIDLVKRLDLYTIRERRDYFLTTLMCKAIHGIAPHYLSDRIDMHFDIHGYNTREAGSMNVYLPAVHKEIYRNSFFIFGW